MGKLFNNIISGVFFISFNILRPSGGSVILLQFPQRIVFIIAVVCIERGIGQYFVVATRSGATRNKTVCVSAMYLRSIGVSFEATVRQYVVQSRSYCTTMSLKVFDNLMVAISRFLR